MTTVDRLFAPRAVTVVGASRHGGKLGAVMARSLAGYGDGPLLVNSRNSDPVAGVYPSVGAAVEASRPVDLAVLCVPAPACTSALADAGGERYQRDLARVVADTGIRLLGPNTSGFFAPRMGLFASFVPGVGRVPAGGVAVVAASGGVNHALAFALANAGNGVSLGVGIGAADVLEYLRTDEATAAVALHVETAGEADRSSTVTSSGGPWPRSRTPSPRHLVWRRSRSTPARDAHRSGRPGRVILRTEEDIHAH
jgi:acetyltransferase